MGMEASDHRLQVESAHPTYISHTSSTNPRLPSLAINGHSTSNNTSTTPIMSQNSSQPVDTPEMDDAMSVDVPVTTQQSAPTRGTSTRGRGRGRWTRNKNSKVTKPAQPKAPSGRGRRHKVYESPKLQAAHERTQELKQAFSAVVRFVKPAVQEIADRSINELLEDPAVHKQEPQYAITKDFLRQRHEDTIKQCNAGLEYGLQMAEHVWQAQQQKVNEEYTVSISLLSLMVNLTAKHMTDKPTATDQGR